MYLYPERRGKAKEHTRIGHMPFCTYSQCAKTPGVIAKSCAKCRAVAYCGVECQKADWKTHKTTCKPCSLYAFEQATLGDEANDWRKTLKWSGFIEQFMRRGLQPGPTVDELRRTVLLVFTRAYATASIETGEHHYAYAAIPLLHERMALHVKYQRFAEQIESISMLGRMLAMTLHDTTNEQVVECFQRAYDIGTAHGITRFDLTSSLDLGRIAHAQGRHADATNLFRAAIAASQRGDGTKSFAKLAILEMDSSTALFDVLLHTGAYDEAEALSIRFSSVLRTAFGMSPKGLRPMQLYAHLQLARVHDARGRYVEMARELRHLIDLVNKNNDAVVEWRHVFVPILQAIIKLVMLNPRDGWDKNLLVEVTKMSNAYGVPMSGMGSDGTKWEQIFI